ncbi:hypothetical protein Hanom_Chr03g00195171 [Helianthus anomalus]
MLCIEVGVRSLGGTGCRLAGGTPPERRGGWRRREAASFGCGYGGRLRLLSGLIWLRLLGLGFGGLWIILTSFGEICG